MVSGQMVKAAREAKRLGIEQLAARIHMRAAMLVEIEAMERVDPIYVLKLRPVLWPDGLVEDPEPPAGWPLTDQAPYAVPDHPALRARLPKMVVTTRSPDAAFYADAAPLLRAHGESALGGLGRRSLGASVETETVARSIGTIPSPWRVDRLVWIRSDGVRTTRLGFVRNHPFGICPNSDPSLPFSVSSWIVVDRTTGMRLLPGLVAMTAAGAAEAADHLAVARPWAERSHPMRVPDGMSGVLEVEERIAARLKGILVAEARPAGELSATSDDAGTASGSRVA